jgi:hypothetical protein
MTSKSAEPEPKFSSLMTMSPAPASTLNDFAYQLQLPSEVTVVTTSLLGYPVV